MKGRATFSERLIALPRFYGFDHRHYIIQSGYTKRAIVGEKRETAVTTQVESLSVHVRSWRAYAPEDVLYEPGAQPARC